MSRDTRTPASVVRLSGVQGLAVAVPQLLGFQPTDSLVVLCLRAPRGRIGPVARIDLFDPGNDGPVDQLVGCAVRYADAAAVLCYHDGPRPGCLDVLLDALAAAEVPVTEVVAVREGRLYRAESPTAQYADAGVPLPGPEDRQAGRLAAAAALAGRRALPDRQALRASVAGPSEALLMAARAELDAIRAPDPSPACDLIPAPPMAARVDAAFATAMAEQAECGPISAATAAELIVLAGDVGCRDRLVARAVAGDDPSVVPMLIAVVSRCPDEAVPGIGAVLAVAAYRYGDGALAHCAVDRVLSVEPAHRMAHLMLAVMAGGLPPSSLAEMTDILDAPRTRR